MEKTFVMIKPDGVQRNLVGEIISRFERKGFKITSLKLMEVSRETAAQHYVEHKDKPFYNGLLEHISASPVVAMTLEGKNVIAKVRKMVGATNPDDAEPGSIRGDYAVEVGKNIVHASDSPESAKRETSLFFKEEELLSYAKNDESLLYE